ncbi:RE2 [Symbiodinium sp. CCMP2592]|nr:RE2 [Symbiodinium sp. CCMP2592]
MSAPRLETFLDGGDVPAPEDDSPQGDSDGGDRDRAGRVPEQVVRDDRAWADEDSADHSWRDGRTSPWNTWNGGQHSWWGHSWQDGSWRNGYWVANSRTSWDWNRQQSQGDTWTTGSTGPGSSGSEPAAPVRSQRDLPREDDPPECDEDHEDGRHPSWWNEDPPKAERRERPSKASVDESVRGPSEKMTVPSFAGVIEGEAEDLGASARSYLRQVSAWQRITRVPKEKQGIILYQNLSGRAWIEAEGLDVDRLASADGSSYFVDWVKDRYLDVQVTQVGRALSDFFRRLKRRNGQAIRDYVGEYDRAHARLLECGCKLPDIAAAWVFIDRMCLEEAAELNLLASVGNVYDLRRLQQAAIVQDRALRKPWETTKNDRGNRWWLRSKPQSALLAEVSEGEEASSQCSELPEDDCVPEEVAMNLYDAFMTHESAKHQYRASLKMRGSDPDALRSIAAEKLAAAKARSYCSKCKRKGHWHKDAICPLNQGTAAATSTSATSGSTTAPSSASGGPAKTAYPCTHVVHVTWDLETDQVPQGLTAITDTACSKTVAGLPWIEKYVNEAQAVGFSPPFVNCNDNFKFGASRVFHATYAAIISFMLGTHEILLKVSIVQGDVPLLLSRPVLGRLGMVLDVSSNSASFRQVNVSDFPLLITETGDAEIKTYQRFESYMPDLCGSAVEMPFNLYDYHNRVFILIIEILHKNLIIRLMDLLFTEIVHRWNKSKLNIVITKEKTLWDLNKAELLQEAASRNLPVHPSWNLEEIRSIVQEDCAKQDVIPPGAKVPPALGKMSLDELKTAVREAGLEVPLRATRGLLMRMLRDSVEGASSKVMTFGRHRGSKYSETPQSYRDWAIRETDANPGASMDLVMFANWCKEETAKLDPISYQDPEASASIPYQAEESGYSSWDLMSRMSEARTKARAKAAAATPIRSSPQRRTLSSAASATSEMSQDINPETLEEIQLLEGRLAVLRDRHGLAEEFFECDEGPELQTDCKELPDSERNGIQSDYLNTLGNEGGAREDFHEGINLQTKYTDAPTKEDKETYTHAPKNEDGIYGNYFEETNIPYQSDPEKEPPDPSTEVCDDDVGITENPTDEFALLEGDSPAEVYMSDSPTTTEEAETFAKELLNNEAFDYGSLLLLVRLLPLSKKKKHRDIAGGRGEEITGMTAGLWSHGAFHGLTSSMAQFPTVIKYINAFARHFLPEQTWSSFVLTRNVQCGLHRDSHNAVGSRVHCTSFGGFEGGSLWIADNRPLPDDPPGHRLAWKETSSGKSLAGRYVSSRECFFSFDPKTPHATGDFSGERWCMSLYTSRSISETDQTETTRLIEYGFPLPQQVPPVPQGEFIKSIKKSKKRGLWRQAKRLAALTAWCTTAGFSLSQQVFPMSKGADAVTIFEIGGDSKTAECGDLGFISAEPLLPDDLLNDEYVTDALQAAQDLKPATVWVHGDKVRPIWSLLDDFLDHQLFADRAIVIEANDDNPCWASSWAHNICANATYDQTEDNGTRIVKANYIDNKQVPGIDQNHSRTFAAYVTSSTTTKPTAKGTAEADERGSNAIDFDPGPEIKGDVQSSLKRLHQNLGHPSRNDMARHLRLAGAGPEVVAAAKRLRCQVCQRNVRNNSSRPSSAPTLLDFNQVVAVDAFSAYDSQQKRHDFLAALDIGTGFCMVELLQGHSTEAMEKTFACMWAHVFGAPGTLAVDLESGLQSGLSRFAEWHGSRIRPIAGQAHWQQGAVERLNRLWKEVWNRIVDEKSVVAQDVPMAVTAVNSALNTLRRESGFSPCQAVMGRDPRLPEDLQGGPHDEHVEEVITRDRQRAREHALRIAAKEAYFKCQSDSKVRRALLHRSRVAGPELSAGDHVYFYRKPKNKKHWLWFGPAVVIGHEGPNLWLSYSGRCYLTAPEHIRRATAEEIGTAFTMRATEDDLNRLLEVDYEDPEALDIDEEGDVTLDSQENPADLRGQVRAPSSAAAAAAPVTKRHRTKGPQSDSAEPLGDTPMAAEEDMVHSANMVKLPKTARGKEKALEKEIPWQAIPEDQKEAFVSAEKKQWSEHVKYHALEPLSIEQSRQVLRDKPERVLPSRFAYKDKAWSKRKLDSNCPWRPKARLVIGGHRDPDLDKGLPSDAPTISRQGVLLLLQVLASNLCNGWQGFAGDITAAFLSGRDLQRELYLRQPKSGLGELHPEQLIKIRKPVFGLVDSPATWWSTLQETLKSLVFTDDDGVRWRVCQCPLDHCIFTVQEVKVTNGEEILGPPQAYLGVHVDDILMVGNTKLCRLVQQKLGEHFPIEEWETGSFEYVGSFVEVGNDSVKISQSSYVGSRLFEVEVLPHQRDFDPATETQLHDNQSLVGALSWLASQSRPDLQASVSMCQQCQRSPLVQDIRFSNQVAKRAMEHRDEGIVLHAVPLQRAVLLCYHDAGWANVPQDEGDPVYKLNDYENEAGLIKEVLGDTSDRAPSQ